MAGMDHKIDMMSKTLETARKMAEKTETPVPLQPNFSDFSIGQIGLLKAVGGRFFEFNMGYDWGSEVDIDPVGVVAGLALNKDLNEQAREALQCQPSKNVLVPLERREIKKLVKPLLGSTLVAPNGLLVWRYPLSEVV